MKTSGSRQIAERYVKALFDVSDKAQDKVENDLRQLAILLKESKALGAMINNPLLTRQQQAKAMDAILTAMKAATVSRQFVVLLAKQKRLAILPEIISIFMSEASKQRGEMKAMLVSAAPIKASDFNLLAQKLSAMVGKKILFDLEQDPELLGGAVIRIGSLQLDASLAGKLRRLKNILKAA